MCTALHVATVDNDAIVCMLPNKVLADADYHALLSYDQVPVCGHACGVGLGHAAVPLGAARCCGNDHHALVTRPKDRAARGIRT